MVYDVAPVHGHAGTPRHTRAGTDSRCRGSRAGARLVLTTSERGGRPDLGACWASTPGGSATVPLGVSAAASRAGRPRQPLKARLGLDRPYVVAVGTDLPRKNLALLDRIAPTLADARARGGAGGLDAAATCRAGEYGIRSLGYVAEADLPARVRGRDAPWRCPRCTRASACRAWRPWRPERRWWPSDRGALPETCGDAATSGGSRRRAGLRHGAAACGGDRSPSTSG